LRASQAGADEFFLAPVNYTQLEMVFTRAIEKRALEIEGRRLLEQVESKTAFCSLIGGSAAMQKVYQAIQAVAGSNTSVVLRGESGTGKELIAQAIVQSGSRADKPYVCLNCSALPETLIESELFGYEKGAFTGADMARPGLIETAHNGTLFLDEISSLNPNLQSKLLRVLQEHSVVFARISTTGLTSFPSWFLPCVSAKAIWRFLWTTFCASTALRPKSPSKGCSPM
jgi:DNA-binding NtrC family response regulator